MSNQTPAIPSSWEHEEALFTSALEHPVSQRVGFLDSACQGNPALRQRLEKLLAAHDQPDALPPPPDETNRSAFLSVPGGVSPGMMLGRYRLLERIGEGGCGMVYIAEQSEPVRRRVALKLIKLGMDTQQVIARFEAERQAVALMDHPNIAKVFDAGATETGRPFFVMELVDGIKITEHCDRHNLTTNDRIRLFIQVCQAVQHAHQKGVIHRDLKPSNVLVTMHDEVPVPKVIDFGIAKAVGQQRLSDHTIYTAFEQFIGTPAYMSPEQAEMSGLDIDTRSDIYSLGVLLFELLTGRTPFDATTLMQAGLDRMRQIICEQEPPRPSSLLDTLSDKDLAIIARHRQAESPRLLHAMRGDLDWIVMKCLEKDRSRRYETANGLATDLQRHLNNEPVVARPPTARYRFQKLVRRNKTAVTAGAAVVLALLIGLAISIWQAIRATHAEQSATGHAERADLNARAEKQQREAAEAEARKARDILAFMQTMFTNTGKAYADKVTVLQMLDWGSRGVRDKFRHQPEVSAAVQFSIGFCYSKIGHWEAAAGFLEDSLRLRSASIGEHDPETLATASELAFVLISLGRSGDARDLCIRIIDSARAALRQETSGRVPKVTFRRHELQAARQLCLIYLEEGQPSLARPLAEEVVAASINHELLAEENGYAWSELGTVELEEGHPEAALKAFENEIQFYNEASIVQRAWNAGMRAAAHLALGNHQIAEELMTSSLPVLEHRFTDTHFRVQRAYRDLIALYVKTGRENEADALRIKSARGLNEIARRFATHHDPKIRNGTKAVEMAEAAVRNTRRKNPACLDTLAAAYAETGQFSKAALTETEAISLLADEAERRDYGVRLRLFEADLPYHQDP